MRESDRYTGEDGRRYLEQRRAAQSEHVQGLRASIFHDLAGRDLVILDFGCGTGGVLKRMAAARRIGVEVGEAAAETARAEGIETVAALDELPEASVDVAISFHALEHVDAPLDILQRLGRVVKPGGRLRLVVPCEVPLPHAQRFWVPNPERHLYTWTPLLFGNLAERAGLESIVSRIAPMPTRSRLVRGLRFLPPLARLAHLLLSIRRNSLNVILDAQPGRNGAAGAR